MGAGRRTREDLIQIEYELHELLIAERRKAQRADATAVAAEFLGVDATEVVSVSEDVSAADAIAVQVVLGEQVRPLEPGSVVGADPRHTAGFKTVVLGRRRVQVPDYAGIPFERGMVSDAPLYVRPRSTTGACATRIDRSGVSSMRCVTSSGWTTR